MNIQEIMSILPHRYPMLLVDRVLELEPGKRVVTLKNITSNEPQFTGHYPGMPILPGFLFWKSWLNLPALLTCLPSKKKVACRFLPALTERDFADRSSPGIS